jgi:hypothetical protein
MFDYSCNDATFFDSDFAIGQNAVRSMTESVIRDVLTAGHAPLFILTCMSEKVSLVEQAYHDVCSSYHVPLISYRAAVIGNVTTALKIPYSSEIHDDLNKMFSVFWDVPPDYPHPGWFPHRMISELISFHFARFAVTISEEQHNSSFVTASAAAVNLSNTEQSFLPVHPLFFADSEATQLLGDQCYPVITSYSTIKSDKLQLEELRASFWPYFVSPEDREHQKNSGLFYYFGFHFRIDVPGKPPGWLAESGFRAYSSSGPALNRAKLAHIAFSVFLMSGRVTIIYSKSYHNCGKIELWLSRPVGYESNGGARNYLVKGDDPTTLICCDDSVNKSASNIYGSEMPVLQSGFLDTFDSTHNTSEIHMKTFRFAASGNFVLHLRHLSLSDAEFNIRGGDKVKIVGINTC